MDHPFYEPGDMATGKVYIRARKKIYKVMGVNLEVKGNAKNSFLDFEWTHVGRGQNERMIKKYKKLKNKKMIMGYKANVH